MDAYRIVRKRDHCEVYIDGKFYCSADNYFEAMDEIDEYFAKIAEQNC